MVLQWARAKEEIDLGKTMKGAQPKTVLQAVCFDMKGIDIGRVRCKWKVAPVPQTRKPSAFSTFPSLRRAQELICCRTL